MISTCGWQYLVLMIASWVPMSKSILVWILTEILTVLYPCCPGMKYGLEVHCKPKIIFVWQLMDFSRFNSVGTLRYLLTFGFFFGFFFGIGTNLSKWQFNMTTRNFLMTSSTDKLKQLSPTTHYSKSWIFVQKFNFDKTLKIWTLNFRAKSRRFHPKMYQIIEFSCQNSRFWPKIGKIKLNFWTKNGGLEQCGP